MEQLFSTIPAVLNGLGPNAEADVAIAFAAWRRCAGEQLSSRTAPIELTAKRLVVAVADKTWQRHLEELSPQMLVKLNDMLGQSVIRFIEFRVDPAALQRR